MARGAREEQPRVSVVIPTYGRPEKVVDAVRSVEGQTVGNVEVVVVDDHSPTPVCPQLQKAGFDSIDLHCVRHDSNQGANAARNTGIRRASGEYVGFLDDDDRWKPTLLERAIDAFEGCEEVGLVHAGLEVRNEDGDLVGTDAATVSGDATREVLTGARIGSFSRLVVRRSVIERAGLPDERYPSWQDMEWTVRLSRHCRFEPIPEPLVVRRVGHEQISDKYREKRDVTYPMFLAQYRPLAASYGPLTERRFVAGMTTVLASDALQNGEYADAVQYALRSAVAYPFEWTTYVFLLLALGGDLAYGPVSDVKRRLSRYVRNI